MSIRMPHCVFVHVPRTGGLWFGAIVDRLGIKHQKFIGDIDSHLAYHEMPPNWRELPAMGFVRHPLQWARSRWSHALEINAPQDFRHYGIHRQFDECVRPTLSETLQEILCRYPGLVGKTFDYMLEGVENLVQTQSLPNGAIELLRKFETLPENWREIVDNTAPFNGTSSMERYRESGAIPAELGNEFMAAESLAIEWWDKGTKPQDAL